MKIKEIASICRKAQSIVIIDREVGARVEQWIGDGFGMFPVHDVPYLQTDSVFTIFDVEPRKRQEYLYRQLFEDKLSVNLDDYDKDEVDAELLEIDICFMGRVVSPVRSANGILFIDPVYLRPLKDVQNELAVCERTMKSGQRYIAVKAGLLIKAVIMPANVIDGALVRALDLLAKMSAEEYGRSNGRSAEYQIDGEQAAMDGLEDEPE